AALRDIDGLSALSEVGGSVVVGRIEPNTMPRFSVSEQFGQDPVISAIREVNKQHWEELDRTERHELFWSIRRGNDQLKNSVLNSLSGLNNTEKIGGNLNNAQNPKLRELGALSALTYIGEHLVVARNPMLEELDAIGGLQNLRGSILIRQNIAL